MGGRMAKAAATKKQRVIVFNAVFDEQVDTLPWGRCLVHAEFFHKTKRRRDIDNAIGCLKATYDGLVDAGVVEDDTPEFMVRDMPGMNIDKEDPRVEITITRLDV
jgi:Holliday junction resolvase RusA-like endonuclease